MTRAAHIVLLCFILLLMAEQRDKGTGQAWRPWKQTQSSLGSPGDRRGKKVIGVFEWISGLDNLRSSVETKRYQRLNFTVAPPQCWNKPYKNTSKWSSMRSSTKPTRRNCQVGRGQARGALRTELTYRVWSGSKRPQRCLQHHTCCWGAIPSALRSHS